MDKAFYDVPLPFDTEDPQWAINDVFRAATTLQYLKHALKTVSSLEEWYASRWALFGQKTEKWHTGFHNLNLARQSQGKQEQIQRQLEKFALRGNFVRETFRRLSTTHTRILMWNYADSVITFTLGDSQEQVADAIASWVAL